MSNKDEVKNVVEKKEHKIDTSWKLIESKFAFVFWFCGVFGFIYEEIFYRIDLGYFVKRGSTYGPWIPIYAIGGIMILMATHNRRSNPIVVFLIGAISSGIVEYATGYVLYNYFNGLRLWDYNTEIWNWGNINGYICFRSILFFGLSGVFLVYAVLPFTLNLRKSMNKIVFRMLSWIPASLFAIDIIVSLATHRSI